ncbi:hypothetical protein Avbf_14128 [Armadillidium vulgare]|nr:hypothetical protein Avbf_14128 [Armadillidium vulgare]
MNTNKAVKGIKGSTPLTDLQGFNIIWGAPPDYMHIILLGVMRTLFELYFTNTGNPWYIGSPKQHEDLSQRSLTGKKHYNSKEIKQPLTPEKRFAIEEAFKDRLKKQQYHDAMIALELKLVNRYIVEKINDVKKCKSRRNLNMTYDIQNKNIPREEEKDLSENEPISNDMIN